MIQTDIIERCAAFLLLNKENYVYIIKTNIMFRYYLDIYLIFRHLTLLS